MWLYFYTLLCWITLLTVLPQVPTKKAKLGEGRLQIMDDEDTLDKYQVRNAWLPLVIKAWKSVFIHWWNKHHQNSVQSLSPSPSQQKLRLFPFWNDLISTPLLSKGLEFELCCVQQTLIDFFLLLFLCFFRRKTAGFSRPASVWSRRTTTWHTD